MHSYTKSIELHGVFPHDTHIKLFQKCILKCFCYFYPFHVTPDYLFQIWLCHSKLSHACPSELKIKARTLDFTAITFCNVVPPSEELSATSIRSVYSRPISNSPEKMLSVRISSLSWATTKKLEKKRSDEREHINVFFLSDYIESGKNNFQGSLEFLSWNKVMIFSTLNNPKFNFKKDNQNVSTLLLASCQSYPWEVS